MRCLAHSAALVAADDGGLDAPALQEAEGIPPWHGLRQQVVERLQEKARQLSSRASCEQSCSLKGEDEGACTGKGDVGLVEKEKSGSGSAAPTPSVAKGNCFQDSQPRSPCPPRYHLSQLPQQIFELPFPSRTRTGGRTARDMLMHTGALPKPRMLSGG